MHIEVKKLEKSEAEIIATVDTKEFMEYWPKGLAKVKEVVEIDGYRKGHVPEDMIIAKFGDMIVLEEMANFALRDIYKEAIEKHKLFPIGEPKVTIRKIAKDNPLELTLVVATLPEFTLPDYKVLAKAHITEEEIVPTNEEVENVLKELQKGRSSHAHDHDSNGYHPDHDKISSPEEKALPEINDDFAKSFGEEFTTLLTLKEKIKENLLLEKKQKMTEKNRQSVIEAIVKETKVSIPEVLLEEELGRMLSQMKSDVTRFGGTWADYLTHTKKTEEEIKIDWRDDAEKRVISQLVLAKIAEIEKLYASEEEIEVELIRLLAQIQDADPERAKDYLRQALSNEKVLRFLLGDGQ